MKYSLGLFGTVLILFALASLNLPAQQAFNSFPVAINVPAFITNTVTTGATNIIGPIVSQNLAISMTINAPSGGATNVFTFQPSVDSVHYDAIAADALTTTNGYASAGVQTIVQTINTKGIAYLKLVSITATGTTTNTLSALSYGVKQGGY